MRVRRGRQDGGARLTLDAQEVEALRSLPGQLRELLALDSGAVRDRLFPRAYLDPTEEEAEQDWQRLMHADLLAGKLEALEVVTGTLDGVGATGGAVTLDLAPDEVHAWLGVLNDLRLALGVMLEVTEELDIESVRPDDPRAPGLHLYGWLTWLQGGLLEALGV